MDNKKIRFQKGVIAVLTVILILAIMMIILTAFEFSTVLQQKIYRNTVKRVQAYYIAESGIEDALWRIKNNKIKSSYTLNVFGGTGSAEVTISLLGNSRTITSKGNLLNVIRKIEVVYKIRQGTSFSFEVQAGNNTITINNGAQIVGNVFSNVGAIGPEMATNDCNVTGNCNITGNFEVLMTAGPTNLKIGGDLKAYSCSRSSIGGDAYLSYGCNECTIIGTLYRPSIFQKYSCTTGGEVIKDTITPPPYYEFPISDSQINIWKEEALTESGGVPLSEDKIINSNAELGPIQIGTREAPKNLTVGNNVTLTVTGTIYVTGNINIGLNTTIKLDPEYNSESGIIIADDTITIGNNATFIDANVEGSSILLLSTKSLPGSNFVISTGNDIEAPTTIFYATDGNIEIGGNSNPGSTIINAGQITAQGIRLGNNAKVQYRWGLISPVFTSSPGGSWGVKTWKEIE